MAGEQSSSQQHNQCEKRIMGFGFSSMDQMPNLESIPELFNLTTGMEMLAFPPNKIRDANSVMWKEYFTKPDASSSNTQGGGGGGGGGGSSSSSRDHFYQVADHEFNYKPTDFMTTDNLWQQQPDSNNNRFSSMVDDSSSFGYVFPCEGEGGSGSRDIMRSEGLSLSLFPNNKSSSTSTIRDHLIRRTNSTTATQLLHHQRHDQGLHQQDTFLGMGAASLHQAPHIQLKDSKYLAPCQDLLDEFCNLGTKRNTDQHHHPHNTYKNKMNKKQDENGGGSSTKQSSSSVDFLELQKRKSKLVSMLEEVDRRYRQYCEQMKSVVSSFEAVVGTGAGSVYSALASKAMSRHFRCLRDAIVVQIKATEKVMGETTDPIAVALGSARGDTPRLRLLDQTHRQQSAFRQMSIIETHPWRPQRGLPERSVSLLRAWLFEHFLHPYPTDVDKHILARQTGLSKGQVSNWFINARVRLWKPMVEEMYLEETKEQSLQGESSAQLGDNSTHELPYQEQKPTPDQLVRGDTGSLSSIINTHDKTTHVKNGRNHNHHQQQQIGRDTEMFGAMDLDFSSYNDQTSNAISYTSNFGNGVSLTLGLQQHGETGSGVNLSSFPSPSQHSVFYPREHIEECEQLEYSILDGEVQNPPYRNLMGVQLLHDLGE